MLQCLKRNETLYNAPHVNDDGRLFQCYSLVTFSLFVAVVVAMRTFSWSPYVAIGLACTIFFVKIVLVVRTDGCVPCSIALCCGFALVTLGTYCLFRFMLLTSQVCHPVFCVCVGPESDLGFGGLHEQVHLWWVVHEHAGIHFSA